MNGYLNGYIHIIKLCLRNRMAVVWMFIFPTVLATLYHFAFSSLDEAGSLEAIPVVFVQDSQASADPILPEVLQSLAGTGGEALLDLTFADTTGQADQLLEDHEAEGYICVRDGEPQLTVLEDGINQTILRTILTQYLQARNAASLQASAGTSPDIQALTQQTAGSASSLVETISPGENPPSNTVTYFYSLLAMVCLYAAFLGNVAVELRQANLSPVGARRSVACCRPLTALIWDLLAYLTVSGFSIGLSVFYMAAVLGVKFGGKWPLVILTCLAGVSVGLLFGAAISITNRLSSGLKSGIIVSFSMVCAFFSGMMMENINYLIRQHAPLLAWINPASRIADAFYCLYYYDNYNRYFQCIGVLAVMAGLLLLIVLIFERRQRYESI